MVQLNGTAAAILQTVDGVRDLTGIVAVLENDYGQTGLIDDVAEFLGVAQQRGWVDIS
jgi:pyrroloquinoline quinone biosynthesis protein D